MPGEIDGKKIFSLLEVTRSIQKTMANRYKDSYWIKAEMNKLNYYRQSGHCYPDLVEKANGKIVAQMRCNLWKDDYIRINNNFQKVLKEPLKEGIKILFLATIGFHPQYGMSLQIIDIDPAFTLGDLEKEKQQTLQQLKEEGIYNKNKELNIPLLPQRIAIISVETSKGYADFLQVMKQAESNWNYKFFHLLFPSLLQGDNAVKTIIRQLRIIKNVKHHFDVVAIIRGGGGDVGLSCYNNYKMAREIALFPIPVLTGIGHSTNETVAEMISFENAITPTKLAEFLIQKFHNFSVPVQKAEEKIIEKSKRLIREEQSKFYAEGKLLRSATKSMIVQKKNEIDRKVHSLFQNSRYRLKSEKENLLMAVDEIKKGTSLFCFSENQNLNQLAHALKKDVSVQFRQSKMLLRSTEQNLKNLSPENVLKRGFSITRLNGKSLRSSDQLKEGDLLKTTLYDGKVISTVKSANKV